MTRKILWSGGFDSTALVVDALRRGEKVEPYYVVTSEHWQKQIREREAIGRILAALPPEMRRLVVKEPTEAPSLREVWTGFCEVDAEFRQRTAGWFSQQAAYMAAAADQIGGEIEMALVQGDHALAEPELAILREHRVTTPIAGITKSELLWNAERDGYADLLRMTWTCEAQNQDARLAACGVCEPCRRRIIGQQRVYDHA